MAHKVMVDGTVYEVTGGKTLIDGTEYSIKNGKTLVDGTVYGIEFAPGTAIVTVTHGAYDGRYWWTSCSATLPDGGYVSLNSEGTYELPTGTVIKCEGGAYFSQSSSATMKIYLNEQVVAETIYSYNTEINYCSYEYTLNGNITLDPRTDKTFTYDDPNKFGAIYITEE